MPQLRIFPRGDGVWPDLENRDVVRPRRAMQIARLTRGMTSGQSSVAIRIDLPDGRVVVAETSMVLFLNAAALFRAVEEADHQRHGRGDGRPKR